MALNDTIGIDIGGANTKVASASGQAKSLYLPLWRENDLSGELRRIRDEFQPKRVGVVITGELADAFASKKKGICSIASSVDSVFARPYYLNVRGQFTRQIAESEASLYAASNWAASATFVSQRVSDCIFVDLGSTTCDVIPIRDGKPAASTTDFERLRERELIYAGALRTNIATILRLATVNGEKYRLASELFAIAGDVHRVLGNISAEEYACDTPDGEPRDLEHCYRRIARILLCDVDELGHKNAHDVARQVESAQVDELAQALAFQARKYDLNAVVGAGLGEFLIAKAASKVRLECSLLSQQYGKTLSKVFPAFAVANLAHYAFQR
ncbi:MAG: hydantoinase/oxoprolinase family protein [Halobacteriota archaeon]